MKIWGENQETGLKRFSAEERREFDKEDKSHREFWL